MDQELQQAIYVENEYGIKYIDYWVKPPQELIDYYQEFYNINTNCHNICLNCQISQLQKYSKQNQYQIKVRGVSLYSDEKFTDVVGRLRKGQRVSVVVRKNDSCLVSTTINYGICIRNSDHPKIYRQDKALIADAICKECTSGLSARSKKIEGWVPWSALAGFLVTCNFIPPEYTIPDGLDFNEQEEKMLITLKDPNAWTKYILGIDMREHQKVALMCTAKNKVQRWGRRSGKTFEECVEILRAAMTEIYSDGLDVQGKEVKRGPRILVVSPFLAQITMIFDQVKDLYSLLWKLMLNINETIFLDCHKEST